MNRVPVRALIAAAALACWRCSWQPAAPAAQRAGRLQEMAFKLTDAGCEPHNATAKAGPIDFKVENGGSAGVTEMEVLEGETLLGERENITEGLYGSFALTLEEGEYTIQCNGGTEEDGTLKVTGEARRRAATRSSKRRSPATASTSRKHRRTDRQDEAVRRSGDRRRNRQGEELYPAPRINYERIEPVAETFGDLDPRIDARDNDVPTSEFGGFHRIEKALWEEDTTKGMKPVAEGLEEDVLELEEKVKGVKLHAVQIANGANELLTEVSTSKITGEEERYSHIDLVDFKANVEGSQVAFEAVAPLVPPAKQGLVKEIEKDFEAVYTALKPYETTTWPGFVLYTELNKSDTRKLAQVIDALAEKLALVPAQIAKGEVE